MVCCQKFSELSVLCDVGEVIIYPVLRNSIVFSFGIMANFERYTQRVFRLTRNVMTFVYVKVVVCATDVMTYPKCNDLVNCLVRTCMAAASGWLRLHSRLGRSCVRLGPLKTWRKMR